MEEAPNFKPGILSRMFSGFKGRFTAPEVNKEAAEPTPASLMENVPLDSSTRRALVKLGFLNMPKVKADELMRRIANCIILDSGCSQTNLCDRSLFENLRPYDGPVIHGIGGVSVTPEQMGTAKFPALIDGRTETVTINDAIYCPGLGANLISISQLAKKGAEFLFHHNRAWAAVGEHTFLTAQEMAGLYIVDQPDKSPQLAALNVILHAYSVEPSLKV